MYVNNNGRVSVSSHCCNHAACCQYDGRLVLLECMYVNIVAKNRLRYCKVYVV